jgi:hypothetical protein
VGLLGDRDVSALRGQGRDLSHLPAAGADRPLGSGPGNGVGVGAAGVSLSGVPPDRCPACDSPGSLDADGWCFVCAKMTRR